MVQPSKIELAPKLKVLFRGEIQVSGQGYFVVVVVVVFLFYFPVHVLYFGLAHYASEPFKFN